MKPDNVIKSIARAVKSKEELKCVTCVYADTRDIAQNPVCSFTLCLGLNRIKYSKNPDSLSPEILTSVKLSLLAPLGAGGKRLTDVAMLITEAVKEALNVSLIEVSEPRFIETSSTMYSDITVTVEEISLADASCEIYLDSVKAEGVISYEIDSSVITEKEPQLLKGYTIVNTDAEEYNIKLKAKSFFNLSDTFELKLSFEKYSEVYKACRVSKISQELSKWGNRSFTYYIVSESCEVQNV